MYVEVFFLNMVLKGLLETFRFKDDYKHEIWLKVLSRILKIDSLESFIYHF